jgi:hypothetical protein
MTPENLRFHAAGHLAAVVAIAKEHPKAAKDILRVVQKFLELSSVDNPPKYRETITKALMNPAGELHNIIDMEAQFCGNENTKFEQAGIRMGKGD